MMVVLPVKSCEDGVDGGASVEEEAKKAHDHRRHRQAELNHRGHGADLTAYRRPWPQPRIRHSVLAESLLISQSPQGLHASADMYLYQPFVYIAFLLL
jgi:hypothetical protein